MSEGGGGEGEVSEEGRGGGERLVDIRAFVPHELLRWYIVIVYRLTSLTSLGIELMISVILIRQPSSRRSCRSRSASVGGATSRGTESAQITPIHGSSEHTPRGPT